MALPWSEPMVPRIGSFESSSVALISVCQWNWTGEIATGEHGWSQCHLIVARDACGYALGPVVSRKLGDACD